MEGSLLRLGESFCDDVVPHRQWNDCSEPCHLSPRLQYSESMNDHRIERGKARMPKKIVLLLVLVGILTYGLHQPAEADDAGLQSCVTYCSLNFDPNLKPSEHAQCVERCKRDYGKGTKSDWDRRDLPR